MNFEIPSDDVRLAHINVRSQRHGEDEVTAVDLKLEWTTSNVALGQFDPKLCEALYRAPDAAQQAVAGVEQHMPLRVFPGLGVLKWATELTGMRLTIAHGLGGKSDLVLHDCEVDRFVIEPLEGGSVKVVFRVQVVCEDANILGKLVTLLHCNLPLTLERQNPVEGDGGAANVKPIKGKAGASATDIFAGTAT